MISLPVKRRLLLVSGAVAFGLTCSCLTIAGQTGPVRMQAPPSPQPRSNPDLPSADEDEFRQHRLELLERSRAKDRQKRIVDDAARLVRMTESYRKALEAHGTPTEDDQKLLAQIEKLAREVKDRMRGM